MASDITDSFIRFHVLNPRVYKRLVDLGRALLHRGYTHIGIGMLWETLRYEYMSTTDPASEFKLNNNYRSRYARTIMYQETDFRDAFETRELPSEEGEERVVFFWDGQDEQRKATIDGAEREGVPLFVIRTDLYDPGA